MSASKEISIAKRIRQFLFCLAVILWVISLIVIWLTYGFAENLYTWCQISLNNVLTLGILDFLIGVFFISYVVIEEMETEERKKRELEK